MKMYINDVSAINCSEEMHGGCDPGLFYNVHRPLLSGWRDNPDLPEGLMYEVDRRSQGTPLTLLSDRAYLMSRLSGREGAQPSPPPSSS